MHAASSEPAVSEKRDAGFPKAARLLKTDEFSSVFRLRPWSRSAHFVIYGRHTAGPARLGLVVGRKFAPRSVSRNLVRRVAREAFRLRRADLSGWDILIRLHRRLDRRALPSAASPPLARLFADEIGALMTKAVQRAGTPPAAPAGDARPVATGAK